MKKNAFTMIELIFVIVVLGILAAIAVPKLSVTRTDAVITKGKSDVAAIRTGIVSERQERLIKGEHDFITAANLSGTKLFDGVMMYGITDEDANGHWHKTGANTYSYKIMNASNVFTYDEDTGKFDCTSGTYCSELTE